MNYKNIKRIFHATIIGGVLLSSYIYSQDCEEGFIYYDTLPGNVNNNDNDSNCFSADDIDVLNTLISLNTLTYTSPLDLGTQTWVTGRLKIWVATYIPNGSNGLTQKINQLPENFGQLSELVTLYIDKHDLTELPDSFTLLFSLASLALSNNWITSLPENIGNLTNLIYFDLGYNQLESIPESIGELFNIQYLYLFNNQLTSLPETICNLNDGIDDNGIFNLNWDLTSDNYPYFASGGNQLCDCELIPDCVENSANVNISMEPNYYSCLLDVPQDCPDAPPDCIIDNLCPELGDINGDGGWNVLDIVTLANCVLAGDCSAQESCEDHLGEYENGYVSDMNDDGSWNVLDIVVLANCVLADSCS